ncbi:MAG TPA: hypothetical protein ENI54_04160 [bacterium]|nr:hypothetical protein [bacterium]
MERVKNWKSYQKTFNKRRIKKNRIVSFVKYAVVLILVILFLFGSIKLYYFGESLTLTRNKQLQGTGIRPIVFPKKHNISGTKSLKIPAAAKAAPSLPAVKDSYKK